MSLGIAIFITQDCFLGEIALVERSLNKFVINHSLNLFVYGVFLQIFEKFL